MFQKKMFSKANTLVISKFLFYPTFPITVMMRIGNYWNVVDKTVILGCAPMAFLGHPAAFHGMGVRGVVNCCAEYEGPKAAYEAMGITQLRIPSVDHYEADAGLLEEAVAFIQGYADRGEKVYVHCKAGHGRAAAVALAWLISQNKQIAVKVSEMCIEMYLMIARACVQLYMMQMCVIYYFMDGCVAVGLKHVAGLQAQGAKNSVPAGQHQRLLHKTESKQ